MSGNGTDLGHMVSMLAEVLAGQERARLQAEQLAARVDKLDAKLDRYQADTKREFTAVRQTVTQYHSSVMGHGFLITEIQDTIRRIADHVSLPPAA